MNYYPIYYPILTPRISSLPIYVTQICMNFREANLISRPNGHEDHQISVCRRGHGVFNCHGQSYKIMPGDIFYFAPFVPHSYSAQSEEPWIVDFVNFRMGSSSLLVEDQHFVCRSGNPKFSPWIRQMYHLLEGSGIYPQMEASKILHQAVIELAEEYCRLSPGSTAPKNSPIDTVIHFMESNFDKDISAEDLANRIGVSVSYLCRIFKNSYHLTPLQYLILLRISKAKEYMSRYPDKSIREISRLCGYHDSSYFGAEFKRITGMTPKTYRNLEGLSLSPEQENRKKE